jgi:Tfp pilus assembly protein PilO
VKKKVPLWLVGAIAIAIAAAAGYWFGIRPKGEEVSKIDGQIAALEIQLTAAERLAAAAEEAGDEQSAIRVADLVRLAKAMPDETDMAGIILELNAAATAAGVQFSEIRPGIPVPGEGYTAIPISLGFEGNYYDLTELVFSLRNLVTVRDGVLDADGRLLTVDGLSLVESEGGFPEIKAVLEVSAYQYGLDSIGSVLDPGATPTAAPGATTTEPAPAEGTTTTGTAPAEGTNPAATTPGTSTTPTSTAPTAPAEQPPADGAPANEQQAVEANP